MFINLENGKLKLYDLRIYKNMDKIQTKLIFDSPYERKVEESTGHYYNGLRFGNDMVYWVVERFTGKWHEYNDNLCYPDERIYEYTFYLYHLTEIYLIIERLKNNDYSALDKLNKYLNNDYNNYDQELFNKYRKQILSSFKLVELVDKDCLETTLIYELLLKNSKDKLKENLINIKKYLNIYELKIDSIPKLVKH